VIMQIYLPQVPSLCRLASIEDDVIESYDEEMEQQYANLVCEVQA